jgi:hypothetical protein
MSDATDTAVEGTTAPAIDANATATTTTTIETPNWLPMRLEQAKRSALSEAQKALGVESLDQAKALIEKARTLEEQSKSDIQKLTERLSALEPAATKSKVLEERLSKMADSELSKLTEAQRAAVMALAKDDKTAALDAIDVLRPTWAQTSSPNTPAPLPAPAKTTAAVAAPAAIEQQSKTDHGAIYAAMKAENPMAAAQYLNRYARQIFPDSK